jgi:hypothetical protein
MKTSFLLVILGFELGTLHVLGRCSTTWVMPTTLCALGYFSDRVLYLLRWGLTNFISRLVSNHDPPDLHLSSRWGQGLYHLASPKTLKTFWLKCRETFFVPRKSFPKENRKHVHHYEKPRKSRFIKIESASWNNIVWKEASYRGSHL